MLRAGLALLIIGIIRLGFKALTRWAEVFSQSPVEANVKVSFGISESQVRIVIAARHCNPHLFAPEPELACLGL